MEFYGVLSVCEKGAYIMRNVSLNLCTYVAHFSSMICQILFLVLVNERISEAKTEILYKGVKIENMLEISPLPNGIVA